MKEAGRRAYMTEEVRRGAIVQKQGVKVQEIGRAHV